MGTSGGAIVTTWREEIVEEEIRKDERAYTAPNGWYVARVYGVWFDWGVYRDDGILVHYSATLDSAKFRAHMGIYR